MKRITSKILIISALAILILLPASCTDDLLDQYATTEVAKGTFWKTEDDATTALYGAYSSIRSLYDYDFYFDGHGEYTRVRGVTATKNVLLKGGAYKTASTSEYYPQGYGDGFDEYYRFAYGGIHHVNYVIENVKEMLKTASASSRPKLEAIVGEARLLRGMVYFRLISMWGDVPYIGKIIHTNSEVEDIARTPISQIKDSIMADFTYAYEKLPNQPPVFGRVGKPAALAFRGKLQLYWACWNNFGWPELDGFTPSSAEANTAYAGAAADFKHVIQDYGLTLFRNGEPGEWGTMGNAEVLPNYFYLFIPTTGNGDPENIMAFPHGGTGTGQGEELMRNFGGRTHESGQGRICPRTTIADRYQSTITGDFCDPLIPISPSTPGARTALNSAINPESYANRDYRMKASVLWDYEKIMGLMSLQETGYSPWIYKTWGANVTIDGTKYISYYTGGADGYLFRKFLRNYAGQARSDGDFAWPVMRLADVFLMYAEAPNEINGPQADAIALVNKVRHRGNLPPLASSKTASKEAFFSAIEQERIVELIGEGHRGFDLRRWRAIERVFGPPNGSGLQFLDTWGANMQLFYQNASERDYEQNYIFRIPPAERERNSNLTQNRPWM